jgi:post-segregation antitoxin (ccd killing protein)
MTDEVKVKPSDAIQAQTEKVEAGLKDVGLGVNTIASRLTSIGIVGVFVVLFVSGCYAFWSLLKDEMNTNRNAAQLFLNDQKAERDRQDLALKVERERQDAITKGERERQDMRWQSSKEAANVRHEQVLGTIKETQKSIQDVQKVIVDSQKSFDRAVDVMKSAVDKMK